jgi:hypothetical protein
MHIHSEQEKEEETGMPIMVMKDEKTKKIAAKVVLSKGVDGYAVESLREALEQLGRWRIILRQ